jgi:septum formation protein
MILASASPRRSELLAGLGHTFRVVPSQAEELHDPALPLLELVSHNAALKAADVARRHPQALVIGADTLVYVQETPLGKPADLKEAHAMLRQLSGTRHQVATAVCLMHGAAARQQAFTVVTHVQFRELSDAEIQAYCARTNPLDKAGAYGIQDHGDLIISGIDGDLHNVIGLPTARLAQALRAWDSLSGNQGTEG